jgi:hypothetical protein
MEGLFLAPSKDARPKMLANALISKSPINGYVDAQILSFYGWW